MTTSYFQLQTLPAPVGVMEGSPILMGENVAVVNTFTWDVKAQGFTEPELRGPIPIFFAEEPDEAAASLDRYPEALRGDYNKLMKRFLSFECLTSQEAKAYVKAPRLGRARRPLWIPEERASQPPVKRTRTSEDLADEFSSMPGRPLLGW